MEKREFFAYVASPLGFSESGKSFYQHLFIPLVWKSGFTVLDPWALTDPKYLRRVENASPESQKRAWARVNKVIGLNNELAIHKCHLLVAVLDGVDVDSGTASEIGYAAALGKLIEGYRGDFRLASDNPGCTVNLQVEHFIQKGCGKISPNLQLLASRLRSVHRRLMRGG